VSDTVLHERAVVEPDAVVERSILGPGSRVMRGASVRDSVLGDGAVVGAGASVREGRVQPGERVEA
jgi:mannose-1-phosphate guanylyltransferase